MIGKCVVAVPALSRVNPLPQVLALHFLCGSGFTREEASPATLKSA
ncbi:hypothetical protein STW0522PSE72_06520 [Pseudomonas monteilii]|nr:hypothetical protein STW0522PSE72_06520 [Pseudomonas monteilii]